MPRGFGTLAAGVKRSFQKHVAVSGTTGFFRGIHGFLSLVLHQQSVKYLATLRVSYEWLNTIPCIILSVLEDSVPIILS